LSWKRGGIEVSRQKRKEALGESFSESFVERLWETVSRGSNTLSRTNHLETTGEGLEREKNEVSVILKGLRCENCSTG